MMLFTCCALSRIESRRPGLAAGAPGAAGGEAPAWAEGAAGCAAAGGFFGARPWVVSMNATATATMTATAAPPMMINRLRDAAPPSTAVGAPGRADSGLPTGWGPVLECVGVAGAVDCALSDVADAPVGEPSMASISASTLSISVLVR